MFKVNETEDKRKKTHTRVIMSEGFKYHGTKETISDMVQTQIGDESTFDHDSSRSEYKAFKVIFQLK